jgi:hypothetical protein
VNARVAVSLSLEAADWAIVGQQVKHLHDYMMTISCIRNISGFVIKALVGLCWMPNDLHRVLKCSTGAALQLSQYVHNVDNKQGLITKVLSYYRSCLISVSCILCCSMCFSFLPSAPMYP